MTTGTIIKLLRTADGQSQTDFAEELGVSRTYLSQVENDRKQPSLAFLRTVSERLAIPLALLLADDSPGSQSNDVLAELRAILANVLSARFAKAKPADDEGDGVAET